MNAREVIFGNLPRTVGNPYQHMVFTLQQFNSFIAFTSGFNDSCFTSICSYENKTPIFEGTFNETDNMDIESVRKVVQWNEDHSIPCIVLFSGNRGFHIHTKFKPQIVSRSAIEKFNNLVFKETKTEEAFDVHVKNDARRMSRIPNTKRINGKWCIPLTTKEIFSCSIEEIINKSVQPNNIDIKLGKLPQLTEFVNDTGTEELHSNPLPPIISPHAGTFFLKDIVRPCIYEKLYQPNPSDLIRSAATIDALSYGIQPVNLVNLYSQLNWIDFERAYTRYRIEFMHEKLLQGKIGRFGKKKLTCSKNHTCLSCILKNGA